MSEISIAISVVGLMGRKKIYMQNRYRKSVFYQFNLFINGKKVLINTRYKDEFKKVLKDNKIEEIIK